jgi:beta-N-acetylhexosaminidase
MIGRRRTARVWRWLPGLLVVVPTAAMCAATPSHPAAQHVHHAASDRPASPTPAADPPATTAPDNRPLGPGVGAAAVLARLTEAQRVGQLLVAGYDLADPSAWSRADITDYHAGTVILWGANDDSLSTVRAITAGLQSLTTASATGGVPLFVSTDQEGGEVQRLHGPGFSVIPTAVQQGQLAPATLRSDAEQWGAQLLAAGVNVNLAPVLDTVPPDETSTNQPIGRYDREYGTYPTTVAQAGLAFIQGMHAAGVSTVVKHFPGLGRADGNTDTEYGVTDTVTTRHDSYITPYAAGLGPGGAGLAMVSLAIYPRIDPNHVAAFSPTVLGGMLRHDLNFHGVVVSDSLDALAVRNLSLGQRAVAFVAAGGDLVLTVDPTDVPTMASALLARARADATFRAQVDAACLRVLIAKEQAGLLPGAVTMTNSGEGLQVATRTARGNVLLYTRTSTGWTGPVTLAATAARPPAIAAGPGARSVELAEVSSTGAVAVRPYTPGQTASWTRVAGLAATSPPAVATTSTGTVDVAVRGPGLAVWVREHRLSTGWGPWVNLGGQVDGSAPGLTHLADGDLAVFVESQAQQILERVRHAGRWQPWQDLGGDVVAGPTVAAGWLFVEGAYSTVSTRTGSAGWTTLATVHAVVVPTAASLGAGRIALVSEQLDGQLYLATHGPSGWSGWTKLPFD